MLCHQDPEGLEPSRQGVEPRRGITVTYPFSPRLAPAVMLTYLYDFRGRKLQTFFKDDQLYS